MFYPPKENCPSKINQPDITYMLFETVTISKAQRTAIGGSY
jgi:hypothetical protein